MTPDTEGNIPSGTFNVKQAFSALAFSVTSVSGDAVCCGIVVSCLPSLTGCHPLPNRITKHCQMPGRDWRNQTKLNLLPQETMEGDPWSGTRKGTQKEFWGAGNDSLFWCYLILCIHFVRCSLSQTLHFFRRFPLYINFQLFISLKVK